MRYFLVISLLVITSGCVSTSNEKWSYSSNSPDAITDKVVSHISLEGKYRLGSSSRLEISSEGDVLFFTNNSFKSFITDNEIIVRFGKEEAKQITVHLFEDKESFHFRHKDDNKWFIDNLRVHNYLIIRITDYYEKTADYKFTLHNTEQAFRKLKMTE